MPATEPESEWPWQAVRAGLPICPPDNGAGPDRDGQHTRAPGQLPRRPASPWSVSYDLLSVQGADVQLVLEKLAFPVGASCHSETKARA